MRRNFALINQNTFSTSEAIANRDGLTDFRLSVSQPAFPDSKGTKKDYITTEIYRQPFASI